VTVYGECEQGCFRDVIYRHHSVFDPMERREAVIVSRIPEVGDRRINARVRMLWMHDTDAGPRLTVPRADAFDHVLVLSKWHRQHVAGMYPFLADKLRQVRNGIQLSYFTEEADREQRVVFTSSPDRGLDKLLELWPQVRARVPEATLAHCYRRSTIASLRSDPRSPSTAS
jgi:hypothetical protein